MTALNRTTSHCAHGRSPQSISLSLIRSCDAFALSSRRLASYALDLRVTSTSVEWSATRD